MEKKTKQSGKFVGCLKRMIVPICLIGFCVVFALFTLLPLLPNLSSLDPYKNLLKDLGTDVTDKDMSSNPVTIQDRLDMIDAVNAFAECKELDEHGEPKSLFDIGGNFIYERVKKDNINIKASKLELNKRTLAAFVNSTIGAGWIEGFFDNENSKRLLSVLEIKQLTTDENVTKLSVVMKINAAFFDGTSVEQEKSKFSENNMYVVYDAEFSGFEVKSATMVLNKLSAESNQLFWETLFNVKGDEIKPHVNSVLEAVLKQLDKIRTEWDLNYYFANEKLVISE